MTGKDAGLMWITIERILLAGLVLAMGVPLLGQGATYRPPRGEGGKPDLNGVWQVLNEANYDLEGHSARPAMALRPGPYGPVPAAQVLALGCRVSEINTVGVFSTARRRRNQDVSEIRRALRSGN